MRLEGRKGNFGPWGSQEKPDKILQDPTDDPAVAILSGAHHVIRGHLALIDLDERSSLSPLTTILYVAAVLREPARL